MEFLQSQTDICGWTPPFIVVIDQNIFEVTEEPIHRQRPPKFVVVIGHSIFEITEGIWTLLVEPTFIVNKA